MGHWHLHTFGSSLLAWGAMRKKRTKQGNASVCSAVLPKTTKPTPHCAHHPPTQPPHIHSRYVALLLLGPVLRVAWVVVAAWLLHLASPLIIIIASINELVEPSDWPVFVCV